jgi:hypothetical protein
MRCEQRDRCTAESTAMNFGAINRRDVRLIHLSHCRSLSSNKFQKDVRCVVLVREELMDAMERRVFLKGASMGVLAFAVAGIDILMTSGEARARAVPYRLLNGDEAETLEALGEALVPGAREAGVLSLRAAENLASNWGTIGGWGKPRPGITKPTPATRN